ncbi:Pr6Pr family membrane protein [Nocardioides zeicaulis]|uniref:Pr6Pr family membrane protein n=1 Tax=Nocardioides zeicaulis TaxID=1776857 RepID=A0ABV6E179_9ACTN
MPTSEPQPTTQPEPTPTTAPDAHQPTTTARRAYAVNAAVAWFGLTATLVISALDGYDRAPVEPGLYGDTAVGAAGALTRVVDTLSYFTIWSNVVVAVSLTLLLARPLRASAATRVLRLSGLLMITVTAIVYQVLLAPTVDVTGWSLLTDPVLHVVTPVLTVVVWVVWGPRGWVTLREVPLALVIPLVWIVWMLVRGAVVHAYPYGFANVEELGYATVATTLVAILVFGLVLAAVFWGVETRLLRRRGPDRG